MNCVHELKENDHFSGAILKKCAVCKRRCLYSKKVFRCKACQGYVHKRCLPFANVVADDVVKTIGVEETSPTMAAVEVEENGVTKSNLPSEESADDPAATVGCDPEASAASLPAPVRKNKKKKRAKKSASKNNLQPPTVANVLPAVPVADVIAPAPAGTKASEIRPLDDNVPAAGEAPSLPAPVRKTTKKGGKKNASTSCVQPSLVANVVSDAIPSKVVGHAGPNVRIDRKPAAVVPSCDDAPPPPPTLSTATAKKAVKKKAVAVVVSTKNVPVVPVPDEITPASGVVRSPSKVGGPAATIVRVVPMPAAVIPRLDAPSIPTPVEKTRKESASENNVPPPPVANALLVVSVADETASAPARTADAAVVVTSLTVAEKKAAKRRAMVARKKAAARSRAPAASGVPAIPSKDGGLAGPNVRIDAKPAAGIIPTCDDAPPTALSTASVKKDAKKSAAAVAIKNNDRVPVASPSPAASGIAAIPSKVTGPAATIVRVVPTPAPVIPRLDAPSIPAPVGKTAKESASKVPPPPVANALPAASGVGEPARTADVPSLTVAEKKAAKRRAKVAKKKAAARSRVPPTPAADFGEVSGRLMASANPSMTELKESPATGFSIASNNVTFVDNIALEESIAIRYNPVSQGIADKARLVRLDVCPDQIYLGSGDTIDEAQDMAAFAFLVDMHLRMNNVQHIL